MKIMFNLLRKSKVEEIGHLDQYAKLTLDIKKRITKDVIKTAIGAAAAISTPFIAKEVSDNISDTYAKNAIKSAATIIFAYQVEHTIRGVREIKTEMKAYEASLKMSSEPYSDTIVSGQSTIELAPDGWEVKSETAATDEDEEAEADPVEDIINKFADLIDASNKYRGNMYAVQNDTTEEDSDDEPEVEDDYNFVIHIGDKLPEDEDDEDEWIPEKKRY